MDERRTARVSEAIREELMELVGYELTDPRLTGITVARVECSPDLKHATALVAVPGGDVEQNKALKALDAAGGFLRHQLAARLDLRQTPELHFSIQRHPEAPDRVEILLRRAKKSRPSG